MSYSILHDLYGLRRRSFGDDGSECIITPALLDCGPSSGTVWNCEKGTCDPLISFVESPPELAQGGGAAAATDYASQAGQQIYEKDNPQAGSGAAATYAPQSSQQIYKKNSPTSERGGSASPAVAAAPWVVGWFAAAAAIIYLV